MGKDPTLGFSPIFKRETFAYIGGPDGREWGHSGSSPTPCALVLTRRLLSRVAVDPVYAHAELEGLRPQRRQRRRRRRDSTDACCDESKFLGCLARSDSLGELSVAFTITGQPGLSAGSSLVLLFDYAEDGSSPGLQRPGVEFDGRRGRRGGAVPARGSLSEAVRAALAGDVDHSGAGGRVHGEMRRRGRRPSRATETPRLLGLSACVRHRAGIDPAALLERLSVAEAVSIEVENQLRYRAPLGFEFHRLQSRGRFTKHTSPVQKNDVKVACPQNGAEQDDKALSEGTVREGPGSHSLFFVLFFDHVFVPQRLELIRSSALRRVED
ncbi:hypothetical protein DL771_000790 [Monosporascus sp. 5C6A]|nr:hypothetical protein DL771_000790 [Monosporascus sp. 5C6A]